MSINLDDFDPLASPKNKPVNNNNNNNNNTFNTISLQQSLPKQQQQHTRQRSVANNSNQFNSSTLDNAANKLRQSPNRQQQRQQQQQQQRYNESDEDDVTDESDQDNSDYTDESDSVTDESDQQSDYDDNIQHNTQHKHKHRNNNNNNNSRRTTRATTTTVHREPFTTYDQNKQCSVHGCIQKRLPKTNTCPIHSAVNPLKPVGKKKSDDWVQQFTKTSTSLGMNKNCCYWRIIDLSQIFEIELFHSTLGGKRVIRINGQSKVNEKKMNDNGSRYNFMVGRDRRTALSIEIRPAGLVGHTYELYVNGRPYDEAKKFWLFNETA